MTLQSRRVPIVIALTSMLAGALYTWALGQDVNWDWRNYHEYNVWALLNGHYDTDTYPAGFQTYFNPAVYFPVYFLRHYLPQPYGLMIIGAVHGLSLLTVYYLARSVLLGAATAGTIAASMLIAASGPMALSEVGTSFSDILTALPVLAGFALLLRKRAFWAGVLIGAAVGLKLTNVVYALGAAGAILFAERPLRSIILLALGGAIGGAVTGGAWSLMLWRETGNPVFPLFNGIFQSKELSPINIMDMQFFPKNFWDGLAYPIYWLLGDNRSSEYPFRDARFAAVMALFVMCIGKGLVKRSSVFTRDDIQFLVLVTLSYAAWIVMFSIQRYAVALELACGPLIVLLLSRCFTTQFPPEGTRTPGNVLAILVALAVSLWTQPGDWGRRPWANQYQPDIPQQLKLPATYFMLDKPTAYVAPLLPPSSRFYQIADIALPVMPGGKFDQRIRAGLKASLPGGVWEMHTRGKPVREELLAPYGLAIDRSKACAEIEGAEPESTIEACPLVARPQ